MTKSGKESPEIRSCSGKHTGGLMINRSTRGSENNGQGVPENGFFELLWLPFGCR